MNTAQLQENHREMVTLILRDAARTDGLRSLIRRSGGRAISLPAFSFETVFDCPAALDFLRHPQIYDWVFFASPQGVTNLRQIAIRNNLQLPNKLACAAPGQASRKALLSAGFQNIVAPAGVSDIGNMLKNNMMGRLAKKKIALVQRTNSPPRTVMLLRKYEALPVPIMCYQRLPNKDSFWPSLDASLRSEINSIIAFDAASLEVLLKYADVDEERIKSLPLGVIHNAIGERAAIMGYENIITSGDSKVMILRLKQMVHESVN